MLLGNKLRLNSDTNKMPGVRITIFVTCLHIINVTMLQQSALQNPKHLTYRIRFQGLICLLKSFNNFLFQF